MQDTTPIFRITTNLLSFSNLQKILDLAVNELIFKMGYLASAIFLIQNDLVKVVAFTNSNIGQKVLSCLEKPLDQFELSLTKDTQNLTVKCIRENQVYLAHHTREYTVPGFSKKVADKIEIVSGDKSNIIIPLVTSKKPFGAIVYVKKVYDDFSQEKNLLNIITKQISIAIANSLPVN